MCVMNGVAPWITSYEPVVTPRTLVQPWNTMIALKHVVNGFNHQRKSLSSMSVFPSYNRRMLLWWQPKIGSGFPNLAYSAVFLPAPRKHVGSRVTFAKL